MRIGCKGCEYNTGSEEKPRCSDEKIWVDPENGAECCRYRQGAIALAEYQQGRWISVKDRLPDDSVGYVAVFAPGAAISSLWPTRWDAVNQCFDAGGGWFEIDEITHWMPLPDPPSEQAPSSVSGE